MPRIKTRMPLPLLALTLLAPLSSGQQSPPDLILLNGKIFTSDSAHPFVEALAIRGERIVATGTAEKVRMLAGPQTKRMDLGDRVVIPGINDAHHHCGFEPAGFHLRFKSMEPTWAEVAEELAAAVAKTPKGTLIHGEIGPVAFEDTQANRASLDKIAPDHPVMLDTWAQHGGVLNSAALAKFGVKEDEADPVAGHFVRTADGKLTGVVYEYAKFQINRHRSDIATEEEVLQQTRGFFEDAVKLGITSVQDMSLPGGAARCLMASRKAPTPIRMRVVRMAGTTVNGRDKTEGHSLPVHPAPLITVSGTKWLLDGSPIERTAAMRKPYTDLPSTSGELDFPQKEMEAMLRESLQNDDQLMVHAVGDRATELFLNAMDDWRLAGMVGQARAHRTRRWNHARSDRPSETNGSDCGRESNALGVTGALRKAFRRGTRGPDATNALASGRGHFVGVGIGRAEQSVSEHHACDHLSGKAARSDHSRASGYCLHADGGLRGVC
jgi:predicted amidohydrolase YtcJ